MIQTSIQSAIETGQTYLGIEFGSTRIKAVLAGPDHAPVASGSYAWENQYKDEIWTYSLEDVWKGLQSCYESLAKDVAEKYGTVLEKTSAIGISGMMHGYLVFDKEGKLLTPFRTWRNTITGQAAEELTQLFGFNIPQRWSIAHLYQAILNQEIHVNDIAYMTTLAGYVHWQLTGQKVVGIGEAAGMFPIDSQKNNYDERMLELFQSAAKEKGWKGNIKEILPDVLVAGEQGGCLTAEGAKLLDPSGVLQARIPTAPPEGDAGTGMVATNSVAVSTGNVSAGTSIFSMVVLEKKLEHVYEQIDMVTTPAGKPVAMVHCNNCTNEINAWASVFKELLEQMGQEPDMNEIYSAIFSSAAKGEKDCGGLLLYNYLSGEPVAGLSKGCPMLVRRPQDRLTFPNFMRAQLYSAVATLKIGMDILAEEQVKISKIFGHGGFFKTGNTGQRVMAAALGVPVSVMETAGEGGAWGMALLAAFVAKKEDGETLEEYLEHKVYKGQPVSVLEPDTEDKAGFDSFIKRYKDGLALEQFATENIY